MLLIVDKRREALEKNDIKCCRFTDTYIRQKQPNMLAGPPSARHDITAQIPELTELDSTLILSL